jgi:hypothetical protein
MSTAETVMGLTMFGQRVISLSIPFLKVVADIPSPVLYFSVSTRVDTQYFYSNVKEQTGSVVTLISPTAENTCLY